MISRAAKSSLLWGLVGGLAFLVLIQGYELLAEVAVAWLVKGGVALVVAVATATTAHLARPRLASWNDRA